MIDQDTLKPIKVLSEEGGLAGPYMIVPYPQLSAITAALDAQTVNYWVDEDVIVKNGKPAVAVVNISRNASAELVQKIMDSIEN